MCVSQMTCALCVDGQWKIPISVINTEKLMHWSRSTYLNERRTWYVSIYCWMRCKQPGTDRTIESGTQGMRWRYRIRQIHGKVATKHSNAYFYPLWLPQQKFSLIHKLRKPMTYSKCVHSHSTTLFSLTYIYLYLYASR